MIKITFKTNNKIIDDEIIVDANFINQSDSIQEEILEYFNEKYNRCTFSLNEDQPYCDCSGIYGENIEIAEIKDIEDEKKSKRNYS